MRFIHTGDIHLGAAPERNNEWSINRGEELWGTFERLIKRVKEEKEDLLIISGDLFHRQPLLKELREVDYLFSTIPETKVVLCAGNHDAIKKGSFYESFEWSENVYFLAQRNVQKTVIRDIGVDIYGCSYYTTENTEAIYDHVIVEDPDAINILVAHGGDEKHIPINRRKLAMSGFDYVALGHIHIPDIDEKNRIAYCGALEPIDINDVGERGYIYGEITDEEVEVKFVPFSKRIYKQLEFEVAANDTNMSIRHELQEVIENEGSDNMYKITMTGYRDPDFEIDTYGINKIGNIVSVIDKTEPDYDFEELYDDNKNNLLGMFIKKYLHKLDITPQERKTLYYGTKALLDAMEDR